MAHRLDHPRVVITGASSGIGAATALQFAAIGASLALAARRVDRLEAVAAQARAAGARDAVAIPTDVREQSQVAHLVTRAAERFGGIDILINNAGVGHVAKVVEVAIEDMQRLIETNFLSVLYGSQAVMPIMQRQGHGHIMNVASVVGRRAAPWIGAYCATKFAVIGLSEALRMEAARDHIHVSIICPASTETEFFHEASRKSGRHIKPIGPTQPAEKVAKAILACARRPRREVYPFRPARLLVWLNAVAPAAGDWLIQRFGRRD